MRVIVIFDLPVKTKNDRREYAKFRKYLIKSGFVMMQESVYTKIAVNQNSAEAICQNVRKNKPSGGLVQMLTVTEKQFSKMEMVIGSVNSEVITTDERFILI